MGWNDLGVQERIDVLGELYGNPRHSISAIMGRYPYGKPAQILGPSESETDPPGFISNGPSRDQYLDFELLLGEYDHSNKMITIFKKGILFVANEIDAHPEHLQHVVFLHEYAHAMHHVGTSTNPVYTGPQLASLWKRKNGSFRKATRSAKEQIAQLATLLTLRKRRDSATRPEARELNQHLIDKFFLLMQRQSEPYRLPEETAVTDLSRLEKNLRLLLDLTDDGLSLSIDHIRRILE